MIDKEKGKLIEGMSELLSATRFAFSGILVGALVSSGGDALFQYGMKSFGSMPAQTTPGAATGRGLFALVFGSGCVAGALLVGDKLLSVVNVGVEDPLFRAVYYTTAIASSQTAMQMSGMTRSLVLNAIPKGSSSQPTQTATASAAATPSCSTGSCGLK